MIMQAMGFGLVLVSFYRSGRALGWWFDCSWVLGHLLGQPLRIHWHVYRSSGELWNRAMAQQLCHPLQSQTFLGHHLSRLFGGMGIGLNLAPFSRGYQDVRAIGFIVPGLIANDMIKQGVLNTVLGVAVVTALVRLVLLGIR